MIERIEITGDPDGLDLILGPSREEVLADFLAAMAPVENDPVAGGAVIDRFVSEYPAEMAWAFGEVVE